MKRLYFSGKSFLRLSPIASTSSPSATASRFIPLKVWAILALSVVVFTGVYSPPISKTKLLRSNQSLTDSPLTLLNVTALAIAKDMTASTSDALNFLDPINCFLKLITASGISSETSILFSSSVIAWMFFLTSAFSASCSSIVVPSGVNRIDFLKASDTSVPAKRESHFALFISRSPPETSAFWS